MAHKSTLLRPIISSPGCESNGNNFKTKEQCEQKCAKHAGKNTNNGRARTMKATARSLQLSLIQPICLQPKDIGRCRAMRPKWYFDESRKTCKLFHWGGCGGNQNKFETKQECERTCRLPKSSGGGLLGGRSGGDEEGQVEDRPAVKQCRMQDELFNLGDVVKFNENGCKSCECNSPPFLTCRVKTCPEFNEPAPEGDQWICKPSYDADNCCQTGYQCVSANPPVVVEEQGQLPPPDACANKICKAIAFVSAPGQLCTPTYDEDGCCQTGVECMPEEMTKPAPKPEICARKRCKLIGFLEPEGQKCQPQFDEDGCCQVGISCVSANPPVIRISPPPPPPKPDVCATRMCTAINYIAGPGQLCVPTYDEDGCCQTGVECKPDPEKIEKRKPKAKPEECARRPCLAIGFLSPPGKDCVPTYDEDGCCQTGVKCEDPKPDVCSARPCPAIGFPEPPNSICTQTFDADGCCQTGLSCVPDHAPTITKNMDVCATRPCVEIGFVSSPDKICVPTYDDDGCCQTGLECRDP